MNSSIEFFKVVEKNQRFDEWGKEFWTEEHHRYFQNLENAYDYCVDMNDGTNNKLPTFSEIEEEFYPPIENEYDVGFLTIQQLYFDDDD